MSSRQGPWNWSAPLHRSRSGASHQRRGVPCQDASLSASLRSADGLAVGLMAVADGHGGSRYWLSEVGSRLACELAIEHAARHLAQQRLHTRDSGRLETLHHWLAEELPEQLVAAWQQAIQADWQGRTLPPEHQDAPFSSQTYGSTLALVVLTPQWWAHTGLGDWDLVLLSDDQADRIISQEAGEGLHGEATESLCLPRASRCFAARTAIHRLSQPCGLVLSTDGLRKSCATDADHLALCRFLLEETQPHEATAAAETSQLDTSLDRISREGSGDDVSVAIACFGVLRPAAAPEPPPPPTLPPAAPAHLSPDPTELNAHRRRRLPLAWVWTLALLACGGVAALIGLQLRSPWRHTPPARVDAVAHPPALTANQQLALRREIKRLCSQPKLISANLSARNSQFRTTGEARNTALRLLQHDDWLGALIVLSGPGGGGLAPLQSCPELEAALRQHWQRPPTSTGTPPGSHDGLRTGPSHSSSPGTAGASTRPRDGSADR